MSTPFRLKKVGDIFEVWNVSGGVTTCIKTGDKLAYCLEKNENITLHPNKNTDELTPLTDIYTLCRVQGSLKIGCHDTPGKVITYDLLWYGGKTVNESLVRFPPGVKDNSSKISALLEELQDVQRQEKTLTAAIDVLVRRQDK